MAEEEGIVADNIVEIAVGATVVVVADVVEEGGEGVVGEVDLDKLSLSGLTDCPDAEQKLYCSCELTARGTRCWRSGVGICVRTLGTSMLPLLGRLGSLSATSASHRGSD